MNFLKIKNYLRIKIIKIIYIKYNNKYIYKKNFFFFLKKKKEKIYKKYKKIFLFFKKKYKNKYIFKKINKLKKNFFLQYEDKKIIQYKLFLILNYNKKIKIFKKKNIFFIYKIYKYYILYNKKLNKIIKKFLIKWDINRLNIIDLLIIKIAIIEYYLYKKKINIKILIKEYNYITNIYSITKNIKFINGILNNILKKKKNIF
ncbi:MAG: hypothetical protein NHG02_00550 [Candidatus Shikimatogenerans bostrichidophilus]|nr:MAG: hypothetical protein NHG02_00550 [Candidatus Shikimatogenerans bostrichidophilus]